VDLPVCTPAGDGAGVSIGNVFRGLLFRNFGLRTSEAMYARCSSVIELSVGEPITVGEPETGAVV
jgi:hypothetical protein